MVAQAPTQIIFCKSVMRSFSRLRFLVEISTKLQKIHFFDNLRTITLEGNMETRQMFSSFSSTISSLTVCNIIAVSRPLLDKIFSLEMVKKDICLGSASKQMLFLTNLPQKLHQCPECLQKALDV